MAQYEAVITRGVAPDTVVAKTALWQYGKKYYFENVDGKMRHVGCKAGEPLRFNIARGFVFTKNYDNVSYKRMEW
jgi:hypothetical protein